MHPTPPVKSVPGRSDFVRTRWRRVVAIGGLVATITLLVTGCRHQHLAQHKTEERLAQLDRTARVMASWETSRPPRLERDLRFAGWYFQHQAERFDANLRGAGWYIERDFLRAGDRLPRYSAEALRIIYGKPERIEENAILLFY